MTVELDGAAARSELLAGPSAIDAALADLRRGRAVFLADGERGGYLVAAARKITEATVELMSRCTTGMLCVALSAERADQLGVQPSAAPASADVKAGTVTGMSLADRARTVRALGDPVTGPDDFSWPGHVFLLRAQRGGVLRRCCFAEAAVDLCRSAGLPPVAALAEVPGAGGDFVRVSVDDVLGHRLRAEQLVRREAAARIPTRHGEFTAIGYRSLVDGSEHVALVLGDVDQRVRHAAPVFAHVHVECLTGDVFGSARCDCHRRLDDAMAQIGAARRGVLVYLRASEGPATALLRQTSADDRLTNAVGGQILRDLGVRRIQPLTADSAGLGGFLE